MYVEQIEHIYFYSTTSVIHDMLVVTNARNSQYVGKMLPSVLWHCWLGVRKSIRPV